MVFLIDCHPEYQAGLDFKRVKAQGYVAAICKATQGTSYVPSGLKAYVKRIEDAGLTLGFYHFLDASDGDRQAAHFVNAVRGLGGPAGKLLVVDFEQHPDPSKTATNRALDAFVAGVKKRTNDHAVICYSGYGFWTGGDSSGEAKDYGIDAPWDARYADMNRHDDLQAYWNKIKGWYWSQPRWGGMDPFAVQFTSAGLVAGMHVDVDVVPHAPDLERLAGKGVALEQVQEPKPHPAGGSDALAEFVQRPLAYLERCKGGPYTPWVSGHFRDGVPAWCENSRAPNADRVARNGSFCAGILNLACRVNGLRIFQDSPNWWAGGVAWWGEHLAKKGVLRKFVPGHEYPPGTLFIRFYTGPSLKDQGHVAVQGRRGELIQSDAFDGVPNPGINEKRTVMETHSLLQRFDGGGWQRVVMPEDWLKG
jgi:GH25 family lysozyme M1 (1,4-beta-N-acetylmuramidase)